MRTRLLLVLTFIAASLPLPGSAAPKVLIIAHRAGWGRAPENTVAAIAKGRSLGAGAFELDVRLSGADAKGNRTLVVFHDRNVKRTTDCSGYVDRLTYAKLRHCDAGFGVKDASDLRWVGRGIRVPTLAAVLAKHSRTRFLIDVKPTANDALRPNIDDFVEGHLTMLGVVTLLQQRAKKDPKIFGRILLTSLDPNVLSAAKGIDPRVRTGVVGRNVHPLLAGLAQTAGMRHDVLLPSDEAEDLSAETVRAMHAAGYQVYVHTANRAGNIRRLIGYGVDGMYTDYPDRVRKQVRSYRPRSSRPCVSSICI